MHRIAVLFNIVESAAAEAVRQEVQHVAALDALQQKYENCVVNLAGFRAVGQRCC